MGEPDVSSDKSMSGLRLRKSSSRGISHAVANDVGTPTTNPFFFGALRSSNADTTRSNGLAISSNRRCPSLLRRYSLPCRENRVRPACCSSFWTRLLNAETERLSSSDAFLSEPARAAARNASREPVGGSRRMAFHSRFSPMMHVNVATHNFFLN